MLRNWQRELQAEEYRRHERAIRHNNRVLANADPEQVANDRAIAMADAEGHRDILTCERCGPMLASECNNADCPHCSGPLR